MKVFVILAASLAVALAKRDAGISVNEAPVGNATTDGRIINGQSAARGQFPWQVGIFHTIANNRQFCGGALIHPEWVLTAAHCVYGGSSFEIILGATRAYDQEPGKISRGISEGWYHPKYNPQTLNNDVAVLKLSTPVQYTDQIQPIRLATSNVFLPPNEYVVVSGWGKTSDQESAITNYLNFVQLRTISNDECLRYFIPELIQNNVLCCDGSQIRSTCNGDSGGPLYIIDRDNRPTHVGIVSFVSTQGCTKGYPSGYSRTSNHIDFINQNTGLHFP